MVAPGAGEHRRTLPVITPANQPYWTALRAHELRLQRCTDCDTLRHPIAPSCPTCLSTATSWERMSGSGTLRSWIVVESSAGNPSREADVPYVIGVVELREGLRLTAEIVRIDPHGLTNGQAVEIGFDDVTSAITLPTFRPAS